MAPSKQQHITPKVIVIGAGISGLACAKELQHRKFDVLVVEARSRPGGRLKGEKLNDSSQVDVGGALIHGISHNPIYQVVDQMGISTVPVETTILLDQDGIPVDAQVDDQVSSEFNQCLEETFDKIPSQQQNGSFGTLFDTTIPLAFRDNLLFKWHQTNLELSCGTSFAHLGHSWNDDEPYEYTGAHVALQESWNAVTTTLADTLDILYDAPICKIQIVNTKENGNQTKKQTNRKSSTATRQQATPQPLPLRKSRRLQGEDATVRRSSRSTKGMASPPLFISNATSLSYDATIHHPRRQQQSQSQQTLTRPRVQVMLQNGKVLEANAVVCTLPLGILKIPKEDEGHVEFDPPLPREKLTAIDQLGCGLLNKCILSFDEIFWPHENVDFWGLVDTPPQLILNASIITEKPILVFMFGGDLAFSVEEMTDVDIVTMCIKVVRTVCRPHNVTVPEPSDYVVTRWGHDAYARGAFVYIPPNVEAFAQLQTMSDPILSKEGEPLILFAGEHTTPYHPSTIHGAFSSGIREAVRLDLKFFPDWNDNLEFDATHLYKRTFSVKRKFQGKSNGASRTMQSPLARRRRDGVMTLRTRPAARNAINGTSSSTMNARSPTKPPARRSNRIAGDEPVVVAESAALAPRKLEDRTLLRSYESYRDWQLISDKAFPIYGQEHSTAKPKSAAQLRARYQQLKPKRQPRLDSAILAKWIAAPVYESDVE